MDRLVNTRGFFEMGTAFALAALLAAGAARASQAYDFGDPTPDEEWMRFLINRARADPEAEADRLGVVNTHPGAVPEGAYDVGEGITLEGLEDQREYWARYQFARQPLAWNKSLLTSARNHSDDMHEYNNFSHYTTQSSYDYPRGASPADRAVIEGYPTHYVGENLVCGQPAGAFSAADMHESLFVEPDYEGRGHRRNMLHSPWREVGIGFCSGDPNAGGWTDFWTIDFGTDALSGDLSDPYPEIDTAFVTGVVYDDLNADGGHQPGERMPGVRVWAWGGDDLLAWHADTAAGGGYAIPLLHEGGLDLYQGEPVRVTFFDVANLKYYEAPELAAVAGDVIMEDDDDPPVDTYAQQLNLRADAIAADFVDLLFGDANLDGVVGIADLSAVADNYGKCGKSWIGGDFNLDGEIGIADLSAVADHYGEGEQGVPEPASAALLALGGVLIGRRRRR